MGSLGSTAGASSPGDVERAKAKVHNPLFKDSQSKPLPGPEGQEAPAVDPRDELELRARRNKQQHWVPRSNRNWEPDEFAKAIAFASCYSQGLLLQNQV